MEEVVRFGGDGEVVDLKVDPTAGEEEGDVDFAPASIARACVFCVEGPEGSIIG